MLKDELFKNHTLEVLQTISYFISVWVVKKTN